MGWGRVGGWVRKVPPSPQYFRVNNFVYHLVYVSKAYIPNLRLLLPPLHVEKFVWWRWWWWVVGGGWWVVVVVESNFSVQLSPKLNNFYSTQTV